MLTGVTQRLTAAERAREPRSLALVAYFDGYTQAAYRTAEPYGYPRLLTPPEARSWRDGWAEGHRERTCHERHGFTPCTRHPPTSKEET